MDNRYLSVCVSRISKGLHIPELVFLGDLALIVFSFNVNQCKVSIPTYMDRSRGSFPQAYIPSFHEEVVQLKP